MATCKKNLLHFFHVTVSSSVRDPELLEPIARRSVFLSQDLHSDRARHSLRERLRSNMRKVPAQLADFTKKLLVQMKLTVFLLPVAAVQTTAEPRVHTSVMVVIDNEPSHLLQITALTLTGDECDNNKASSQISQIKCSIPYLEIHSILIRFSIVKKKKTQFYMWEDVTV